MSVHRTKNANPLMSALKDGGPSKSAAVATVRAAVKVADGKIADVAKALGVHYITALRLIQRAELTDYASKLRVKAGVMGPKRPVRR